MKKNLKLVKSGIGKTSLLKQLTLTKQQIREK
jgi:hypothetical protein